MQDFRYIIQASNALKKIPKSRRELAMQYVWQAANSEEIEVGTPPEAETNGVATPPPAQDIAGVPSAVHDGVPCGAVA